MGEDDTIITNIRNCLDEVEKQCRILDEMRVEAEKKVDDWNKDEKIRELEERIVELCKEFSAGFNPSKEQWEEIEKWQERHAKSKHRVRINPNRPRKFIPGLASYSYEFSNTHLGTMGMVVCDTCRAKAFKESLGNKELYKRIMERKNAEYFIGEV